MLPFERKLWSLKAITTPYRKFLEDAIISDLADECFAFSQDKSTGRWDTPDLKKGLELLNILVRTNWNDGFAANGELRASVRRILLQFRAFVNSTMESDDFLPNRRQRLLSNASKELIDAGFKAAFGPSEPWRDEYEKKYNGFFAKLAKQQLWQMTRSPCFKSFYLDNWDGKSQIVASKDLA
jgi:hypothetical protein